MSREFTQKERDLIALLNQADDLVTELRKATRNVAGYSDTANPLADTVKALAWRIEEMSERMQLAE